MITALLILGCIALMAACLAGVLLLNLWSDKAAGEWEALRKSIRELVQAVKDAICH